MKLAALWITWVICGCAAHKPIVKAPERPPNPIAAFAIACRSASGIFPQSVYIVFDKTRALHWTRDRVTLMQLDANGNERDTDIGPVPFEPILQLARSADITDELKLGYGCDVVETI